MTETKQLQRNKNTRRNRMKCTFFSLIELLIVTAIIAILAAMLLPALNKARQKAYAINCANNFKQVGISMSFYLNDNDEMFPRYGTSEGGKNLAWSGNLARGNYLRSAKSLICPAIADSGKYLDKLQNRMDKKEFLYSSASNLEWTYISPGYNFNYLGEVNRTASGAYSAKCNWTKLSRLKSPSRIIQFADSKRNGGSFDSGFYIIDCDYTTSTSIGNVWGRHGGTVTTLWCDGHVTSPRIRSIANPYLSDPFRFGKSNNDANFFNSWK